MCSLARHEHTSMISICYKMIDLLTYIQANVLVLFSPPHSALQPDVHLTNHIGHAQHMRFALLPVFMIISTLSVVLSMEFTRSALNHADRLMENTGCCGNNTSCYGNHCFFVVAMVSVVTTPVAIGTNVCCYHGCCGNNTSCYGNHCLFLVTIVAG